MIKIIYLTNTYDIESIIELECNNRYNFDDIKFCGLQVDTNDNHIIYITKILKTINDKLENNCLVFYNDILIHINIDEYKLTINKINEIINKFNIKQVDNYKLLICKRYINLKKNNLNEIIKLNKPMNDFKNELNKIKGELSNFLCIDNHEKFSLLIVTFNLDMNQTFYTKEIISSMTLKKEMKEIKLKQNENKQFDLIDEYFNLLLKFVSIIIKTDN